MDYDLGVQPLDEIMTRLGLTDTDVVRASPSRLTFKMLRKGRKGRRLTMNAQCKILEALHVVRPQEALTLKSLFNY